MRQSIRRSPFDFLADYTNNGVPELFYIDTSTSNYKSYLYMAYIKNGAVLKSGRKAYLGDDVEFPEARQYERPNGELFWVVYAPTGDMAIWSMIELKYDSRKGKGFMSQNRFRADDRRFYANSKKVSRSKFERMLGQYHDSNPEVFFDEDWIVCLGRYDSVGEGFLACAEKYNRVF